MTNPLTTLMTFLFFMTIILFGVMGSIDYVSADPKESPTEFVYKDGDETYTLHLMPVDEESERLAKLYKIHTYHSSLGSMIHTEDEDAFEASVLPITIKNTVLIREGFTLITNEDFGELLEQAKKEFGDLEDVAVPNVMRGLFSRGFARPILRGGEYVEDEFMIHNVILEYWGK